MGEAPRSWQYFKDGDARGPLTEEEFAQALASGEVGPETPVWNPALASWMPASKALGGDRPPGRGSPPAPPPAFEGPPRLSAPPVPIGVVRSARAFSRKDKLELGCLGLLVLVLVLVVIIPPAPESEKERQQRLGQEQADAQREPEAKRQEGAKQENNSQFLPSSDGSPMGVTDFVLDSLHHRRDIEIGQDKVLPESHGMLWKVSQIVKGSFWSRYAVYEYISNDVGVDAQFAVKLHGDSPMIGSDLPNGCFRFMGTVEGKNMLGTVVPMLLFRKEQIDHPLCKQLDQQ